MKQPVMFNSVFLEVSRTWVNDMIRLMMKYCARIRRIRWGWLRRNFGTQRDS